MLYQTLHLKFVEDPSVQLTEQDFQDFEVYYSVVKTQPDSTILRLSVTFPYLGLVWSQGSQALLNSVFDPYLTAGIVQFRCESPESGLLEVAIDAAGVASSSPGAEHCVNLLSVMRMWLLIGPLTNRLQWLRDATARADVAAKAAKPGHGAAAAEAAIGAPPPMFEFVVRPLETLWIVCKPDRILIIMSIHLNDEVEVALGRAFCQEFAETNRKPAAGAPPCTFNQPLDVPVDLRSQPPRFLPNVGFITLTLSDQSVRNVPDERIHALSRPIMTFRNFFQFHLKHAKGYLHSRLRKRLDGWHHILTQARRAPRKGQAQKRRLVSGKEFVPAPRVGAGVAAASSTG